VKQLTRLVCRIFGYEQLALFGESEVAAVLYTDDRLDGKKFDRYLDSAGSVSALAEVEIEVDVDYIPNHNELYESA